MKTVSDCTFNYFIIMCFTLMLISIVLMMVGAVLCSLSFMNAIVLVKIGFFSALLNVLVVFMFLLLSVLYDAVFGDFKL